MKNILTIEYIIIILVTILISCNVTQSIEDILFDPDFKLNISQLIAKQGYPVENHFVTTKDGYIISLQRIPNGINKNKGIFNNNNNNNNTKIKPTVLLQHGLEDIGTTWVFQENRYQSLGFILADEGYDVWIGNVRGTIYSNKHLEYTVNDDEYWDFTFNEMGEFDLPSMVDYIINVTGNSKVNYIGHSQGTTMGFIGFKDGSELTKKINTFFALAPVARVTHCQSPLFNFLGNLRFGLILKFFGVKSFLMDSPILRGFLAPTLCSITPIACTTSLGFITGWGENSNLNETRLPVILSQSPGGTSTKNIIHWSQNLNNEFQKFDYGSSYENFIHYSQSTPPKYNITNFSKKIPTIIFTGGKDLISTKEDYNWLLPQLKNLIYYKHIDSYSHLDFVWGNDAYKQVYSDILKYLLKYN
ncbi:carboxylic ester hydrolase [Dictyostelium discoideum AX4]|uniref:Lipase n=1 Tax=Dictyostelium discoideum TaxID=44689 RepID=Q55EU8_DICDI|nr:carboxylic ester hydrolase [Dictyostelium discoideum AX4]EAL72959.1 carboxylic ester hydrolase [Dictyostelium discoideum AX4]|eukprot:XP_646922.1 carboxylic ester hydrolase [Dictyostelium discoideum AX4]